MRSDARELRRPLGRGTSVRLDGIEAPQLRRIDRRPSSEVDAAATSAGRRAVDCQRAYASAERRGRIARRAGRRPRGTRGRCASARRRTPALNSDGARAQAVRIRSRSASLTSPSQRYCSVASTASSTSRTRPSAAARECGARVHCTRKMRRGSPRFTSLTKRLPRDNNFLAGALVILLERGSIASAATSERCSG